MNFDLGRWETAARLAADSLSSGPVGEINPDRYRISRWVPLIVATGDFDLAGTQLDRLGELLDGVPVEAQFSGNFHAAAAELALWEGRPDDALDEIELGLERIGDQGWLWFNARLHRIGAWAAADVAEQARSRRDRPAVDAALRRGEALRVARHEILARMLEHEHGRQAAMTIAEGALADAEDTRLRGSSDAAAWAAARESWAKVMRPYLEAYAAWREGEAYLVDGDRAAAATALRSAHATASELGARPLREAIESLAKRARIDLVTTPTAGARRGGARRSLRPDEARARGAGPGRAGPDQPPDRRRAVHQREHRGRPRVEHPGQARRGLAHRGRRGRRSPRPRRRDRGGMTEAIVVLCPMRHGYSPSV